MNSEPPSPNLQQISHLLQLRLTSTTTRRRRPPPASRRLTPPVMFVVFAAVLCSMLAVHLLLRLN